MTQARSRLTKNERLVLAQIGLSQDSVALYGYLLGRSDASAQEAALELGTVASAVYRLFYRLEALGLIQSISGRPRRFRALAKHIGLPAAVRLHQQGLVALLGKNIRSQMIDGPELIVGRSALYDRYEMIATRAAHTIQAYTIGIAYSESLWRVQSDAVNRGVYIQHVVQQVKPSNYHVINKWQRLGIKVRHAPAGRGYHIMVFDGREALVSFSNPMDTDNRLSIYTDNLTAVRVFAAQFRDIWIEAQKIS